MVFSWAGVSRSVTAAAAYLVAEGYAATVDEALALVRQARPRAQPFAAFERQLRWWAALRAGPHAQGAAQEEYQDARQRYRLFRVETMRANHGCLAEAVPEGGGDDGGDDGGAIRSHFRCRSCRCRVRGSPPPPLPYSLLFCFAASVRLSAPSPSPDLVSAALIIVRSRG